jgi:hypothetical protein
MMSRFLVFKKLNDREWMILSKIGWKSGEESTFSAYLLGSTLKRAKLLERTVEKG